MRRRTVTIALAAGAAAFILCSASSGSDTASRQSTSCSRSTLDDAYVDRVTSALRAPEDVWGNALLATPRGPTYAGARRYLKPLLLARGPRGAPLTASGVHYVPFSGPVGARGAGTMALHVADGSQILAQRASGESLTISVGRSGDERYGSCLARLSTSRLVDGYLPILETRYRDADGARYRQESFATRIGQTRSLVSLVELSVDAEDTSGPTRVRFSLSARDLTTRGSMLVRGRNAYLAFGPGGRVAGSTVTFTVPAGGFRTVYVAVLNSPGPASAVKLDRSTYESARWSLVRYWDRRLSEGGRIAVPERLVEDAYRNLLIQNLGLTWRYSVGNPYQQFSFPEGVDVAQVMSAQGFETIAHAILIRSFATPLTRYPNWKMGQKLVGSALYYRLFRDRSYVQQVTPALRGYVARLGRQIDASPRGMLARERFSSDIADPVLGLHSQAVVWEGLRSMAAVWAETGDAALAARARALAARLGTGLRAAIRVSERRLPDGSLFVPARLLDPEKPYDNVTESRTGGYWNLVAPYAFASGLFAPGSVEANGVIRYLLRHGARFLGLVRAGAYSLYGVDAVSPTSGVNPVYGLNVARFLADNDRPDQLVLSLYGQLAAGMTPGTFVSGEGLSVAPLPGDPHRTMYLPPNGASNASFLETLRLMLVHETRSRSLAPRDLELAYATPRAWLAPGKRIVVRDEPTSFGPVSFSIAALEREVDVHVDAPGRTLPRAIRLRLRLPRGHIAGVTIDGQPYDRFDPGTETIELPRRAGPIDVVVRVA